jgi:hypothetical protein
METKVCSKCKEEKKVCEFGNLKKSKDGLLNYCKQCNNKRSKKYRKDYYEKTLEQQRKWRSKNPEWVKSVNSKNYLKNKEYYKTRVKEWYKNNPQKRKQYRENYKPRKQERRKERNENDPIFNLVNRVRYRIIKYLKIKNITKKNKTFEIVGCTPQELKEHLEKKFLSGMTWENRNEWHIDHIIPLSSAKSEDEILKLCHYTNLQPLWANDNIRKSNKILQ